MEELSALTKKDLLFLYNLVLLGDTFRPIDVGGVDIYIVESKLEFFRDEGLILRVNEDMLYPVYRVIATEKSVLLELINRALID